MAFVGESLLIVQASITDIPSGNTGNWRRYATLKSLRNTMLPSSYGSSPAIMRKNVVLPIPFLAIKPILSPSYTPNVTSENNTLSPNDFDNPSICKNDFIFCKGTHFSLSSCCQKLIMQ